jgi:glutamate dehydrogenase
VNDDLGDQHRVPAAGDEWVQALAAHLDGPAALWRAIDFAGRVSGSYQEQTSAEQAATDLAVLDALGTADANQPTGPLGETAADLHRFGLTAEKKQADLAGGFRLRRYGRRAEELSSLLPLVESFGLVVVEAVPHLIRATSDQPAAHIDDIGLHFAPEIQPESFDVDGDGARLIAALEAVVRGRADLDSLNRLVLGAGADWHKVALLRAYRRYRRQTGVSLDDAALDEPLVAWPEVTRRLIDYARARFATADHTDGQDPDGTGADGHVTGADPEAARRAVLDALGQVQGLEQDQVLRAYLALIDATVRTNWLVRGPDGEPRPTIVVKLDSAVVPGLTPPLPKIETWVHAPGVEAIHLRNGLIARGGIRWSDRPHDFRTEVLDLAEAQIKKNAIIVPTGAKGGFVVRSPWHRPMTEPPHPPTPAEVEGAYRVFIEALFDVTDNVVDDAVVHPPGVAVRDGEDPYLVVAADRGTATFSDVANEISARHRFWLGDAFASGGSSGYDHKAMGITARGAWVAARRHFHELGVDVTNETIRLCGVGDMSGDVFGNGMLQSAAIALVAAFDHRHIFLDPDPDPARSFFERRRLFELPGSSWDDYDRSALSPGGGVWPRDAKVVTLTRDARRALGVLDAELSPPEVISAILRAPVDLMFFGGIGTFIKGPGESNSDVGDPANDGVRVSADDVRARVITEGANLGVTQRGRIRYSRRGGRINTDFIDNAAGVATSDREVNLKIMLGLAIDAGRILRSQRTDLLLAAEEEVAAAVLAQVDRSVDALSRAVPVSADELDAHEALLARLEAEGILDRAVEHLPDGEEFALRRAAGAGLIRPELAVLLAYAKSDLVAAIEDSSLVRDGTLHEAVVDYFPSRFRPLGEDLLSRHRLAEPLAATILAGDLIDQMGIAWAHETAFELDRGVAEVAAAFWAARLVLDAGPLWEAIREAALRIPAEVASRSHRRIAAAVGALARRYLALCERPEPLALLASDRFAAESLLATPPTPPPAAGEGGESDALPDLLTRRLAAFDRATYVADATAVARRVGLTVPEVIEAFVAIDAAVAPDLIKRLEAVRPRSRWAAWQTRALIDDLVAWRPRAVTDALRMARVQGSPPGTEFDPRAAVAAWVAEHQGELTRVDRMVRALDPEREDVLSVAALLARALAATA